MAFAYKQDNLTGTLAKWFALGIFISLSIIVLSTFHSSQLHKLNLSNQLSMQKSSLITQLHSEMLLITRTQLQILHASSEQEARAQLWKLSELVSEYLIHYHQLEGLSDSSDAVLLTQFRRGFEQWHSLNKSLLNYANVVADTGFINTLNRIDLAFSQFDNTTGKTLQLIAQLRQDVDHENELSN